MKQVKVIANYLPQYHEIPENSAWWGEGYTDWVAVKKSVPLYNGHEQPRVPQSGQYYHLDDPEIIRWQAKIAREHGVDAFGIYHYWFSSEMKLLEKPAELLLNMPDVDIGFMFIWDNSTWRRTWSNVKFSNDWAPQYEQNGQAQVPSTGILAELKYGNEEDWIKHFNYLLPFFKDSRYVKSENRPVFCFFNPDNDSDVICQMCACWDRLARENGFAGVRIIEQRKYSGGHISDYSFMYQPPYTGWYRRNLVDKVLKKIHKELHLRLKRPLKYNYDAIWKGIIRQAKNCTDDKRSFGAFVEYDDSPRRGKKGTIVIGGTPKKFEKYMSELLRIAAKKEREFIFLTAWNEWGEGAYMEPDTRFGDAYLKALKNAVDSTTCTQ